MRNADSKNDNTSKEIAGMVAVVEAYHNIFTHNFSAALKSAETALSQLSEKNIYWRSKVGVISGDARLFSGNPREAYHYYLEAHRNNLAQCNTYLALSTGFKTATTLHYLGRLAEAETMTRNLLEVIKKEGLSGLPRTGLLWTLLGDYHRETGNFEEAERCIERGLHLSETEKPSHGWNYLYKIACLYSQGFYDKALDAANRLEKLHTEVVLPNFIVMPLTAWKALLYLKLGKLNEAAETLDRAGIREDLKITEGQERCYLALAACILGSGKNRETSAAKVLTHIEEMASRGGNMKLLLEILLAKSELAEKKNQKGEAEAELEKALQLGHPAGYFRVFIDEGRKLASVYTRCLRREGSKSLREYPNLRDLKQGINIFRWYEYSLNSSLMIILIAMLFGVYDIGALITIFILNASMNWFGLLMEKVNQYTEKVSWSPFVFGSIAGIGPWVVIIMHAFGNADPAEVPWFVYAIIGSYFVFFNLFPSI